MAPLKTLAVWFRVMAPLVALKLAVPLAVMAVLAAWLMAPLALTARLAAVMVPRLSGRLLVRATVLAPVLLSDTAPLKALARLRVMAPLVALKLAVPAMVRTVLAAWLMAPLLVTARLPATLAV